MGYDREQAVGVVRRCAVKPRKAVGFAGRSYPSQPELYPVRLSSHAHAQLIHSSRSQWPTEHPQPPTQTAARHDRCGAHWKRVCFAPLLRTNEAHACMSAWPTCTLSPPRNGAAIRLSQRSRKTLDVPIRHLKRFSRTIRSESKPWLLDAFRFRVTWQRLFHVMSSGVVKSLSVLDLLSQCLSTSLDGLVRRPRSLHSPSASSS